MRETPQYFRRHSHAHLSWSGFDYTAVEWHAGHYRAFVCTERVRQVMVESHCCRQEVLHRRCRSACKEDKHTYKWHTTAKVLDNPFTLLVWLTDHRRVHTEVEKRAGMQLVLSWISRDWPRGSLWLRWRSLAKPPRACQQPGWRLEPQSWPRPTSRQPWPKKTPKWR